MTKLLRTVTAPEDKLPPALQGPDLVTAVRVYGCPGEHPLPITQATFSVGSSSTCDVRIASEYISPTHCMLLRREQRLRVQDLDSHNGTFFRGRKETAFDIAPGDTFNAATTRLLALNEDMRLARPVLSEVLGRDQESAIDDVLVTAVLDGPILVIGPRGAGQSDLVRAIHDISIRRNQAFVEVSDPPTTRERQQQIIDDAQRGTLVLNATGDALDEGFLDTVLSPEHGARLVLLALSLPIAMRTIKLNRLTPMSRIDIRPLRERPGEIGKLLDLHLVKNGSSVRLADLRPENQEMLLRHNWPDNLDELRQIAAIIAALLRQGSIRKASDMLKIPRSTMQYWIKRFQLTFPLLPMHASPPVPGGPDI